MRLTLCHIGITLSVLLAFCPKVKAAPPCNDCNVILISLDTVAAKHLDLSGSATSNAPQLSAFAKKARVYKAAYSTSAWTLPGHGAMLTGNYPWRLGLHDEKDALPQGVPTLAETLKTAGYKTAAFSTGYYIDPPHGFARGFDTFTKNREWKDGPWIVKQAQDWLTQNRHQKFFLFLHSYHAHEPFIPSESSLRQLDPHYKGALNGIRIISLIQLSMGKLKFPPSDLARLSVLYRAGILDLDQHLGRLFKSIEDFGLDKNTVILVTSDHGQGFGEHDLWGQHSYHVYEELVRIPLILRTPHITGGEIQSPVSLVDVTPTILAQINLKTSNYFDGQKLPEVDTATTQARTIFAQTSVNRVYGLPYLEKEALASRYSTPGRFDIRKSNWGRVPFAEKMVRSGRYKLILRFDRSFELFDIAADPEEKKNIVADRPEVAHQLKTLMLQER